MLHVFQVFAISLALDVLSEDASSIVFFLVLSQVFCCLHFLDLQNIMVMFVSF
jgi:hypothetical protein